MSHNNDIPDQQLAGYTLLDRLGSGGYGEVWRATAPGGLSKAVKFVFGRQDGARAASELKALQRVLEVRHPFLLSLERIEVVQGRLVVVSELADGSLRDRYFACLEEGQPGIPREELLGYLRDTADALDYLSREHELQHLDVKPENLLLLAGHIKVADFGLVKSVGSQTQSMVGGLTPTYSSPEVFQGRPSRHSDQYSLAVLYQELLTGALPYTGSNAAELTLQHLNDTPDLSALAEGDRFAVSRALAKDPANRFESCSDFVQSLASDSLFASAPTPISQASPPSATQNRIRPTQAATHTATEVFEDGGGASSLDGSSPILIDLPPLAEPAVRYEAFSEEIQQKYNPTPAVFIGIGGTAGSILRQLRQQLSERFDLSEPLATMPMLLLDTDRTDLMAATRESEQGRGLLSEETIALPLRRPQDYREKSPELLNWLSRRWLYNIPRSRQTEGIRPLGRLALVDHARQTFQCIRRTLSDAISQESREAAHQQTGVRFGDSALRVYLCASVSGGTGSGMLLDVAYAVRAILSRLQIADAKILGIATHSSGRDAKRGELARVNAYSWLSECRHFDQPENAYPGDTSCGLPGHSPEAPPFDDTYLVDLGDGLNGADFDRATRNVADYLYLDCTSASQGLLDEHRLQKATLRTFSTHRVDKAAKRERERVSNAAVRQLFDEWTGRQESPTSDTAATAARRGASESTLQELIQRPLDRLKLNVSGVLSLCQPLIQTHVNQQSPVITRLRVREGFVGSGEDRLVGGRGQEITPPGGSRAPLESSTSDDEASLENPLREIAKPLASKLASELRSWVTSHVCDEQHRLHGARYALSLAQLKLSQLRAELEVRSKETGEAEEWSGDTTERVGHDSQVGLGGSSEHAFVLYAIQALAVEVVSQVAESVDSSAGDIDAMEHALEALAPSVNREVNGPSDPNQEPIPPEIAETLRGLAESDILRPLGGLAAALSDETSCELLRKNLFQLASKISERVLSGFDAQDTSVAAAFACPVPLLANCGSVSRRLMVREEDAQQATRHEESKHWTEITGEGEVRIAVQETELMSIDHVAAHLVNNRRDYAELAERVHTRKDIRWSQLIENHEASNALALDSPAHPCTQVISL